MRLKLLRDTAHQGHYYDYDKQGNSQCLECNLEWWSSRPKRIRIKVVKERVLGGATFLSQPITCSVILHS